VIVISLANWMFSFGGGEGMVLDLAMLKTQLITGNWQENLWIYLIIFSTLIPTALHFIIALMATVYWLPRRWIEKTVETLKSSQQKQENDPDSTVVVDSDARRIAWLYMVLTPLVAIPLSLGVIVSMAWILIQHMPDLIDAGLNLIG